MSVLPTDDAAAAPAPESKGLLFALGAAVRAREAALVVLAALVGVLSGLAVTAISRGAQWMHHVLFGIRFGDGLSAVAGPLPPYVLVWPAVGGLGLGLFALVLKRWRPHAIVDPIEANALHGGRMSLRDSAIIAFQTMWSNGFGGSVGMEAGYTQAGSGIASLLGRVLHLRRNDLRILVGCGAAGGIAAAFHSPLTGAFYSFELIIGVYAIPSVAPVMTSALIAYLTAVQLGADTTPITVPPIADLPPSGYLPFLVLGVLAGGVAIAIMRLVTLVERGFARSGLPAPLRPMVGGLGVGALALYSPQVLSSGEGALHIQVGSAVTLSVLLIFLMKASASALSLGSGFRGGLFFASLFMGTLLGKLFAAGVGLLVPTLTLDPVIAAVVGMSALAVGIIGGPFTMTFLTLDYTSDMRISGLVLTASIISSLLVRETFGYSFSTWRLHLRGETIRSALDVGWLRVLTVGRMMRQDVQAFGVDAPLSAFRAAFPLGSVRLVVLRDEAGRYAGLVSVAEAHAAEHPASARVGTLAHGPDDMLLPGMNVKEAAEMFDRTQSDELAVVDDPLARNVVGVLGQTYTLRRYAEELDKARRGLSGDR